MNISRLPRYVAAGLVLFLAVSLILGWFTSDPLRAAKVDSYILFSMSETAHFCYARIAFLDPFVLLNPNAKPLYALVSGAALSVFPAGLFTLKALNSLLSTAALLLLFLLARQLGQKRSFAAVSVLFCAAHPLFFLASFASLSEILFCFLLIAAVYAFSLRRFQLSAVLVSVLVLVRQEGALYSVIWMFFFIKEKKTRFIWILFSPLIFWIIANTFILGHSPLYSFFVSIDLPGPTPPHELMTGSAFRDFAPLIFFHPVFFLFIAGLYWKTFDRLYRPVVIPLAVHCLFLAAAAVLQFAIIKKVSSEFRYIIVLMPFIALFSSSALEKVFTAIPRKARIPSLAAVVLVFCALLFTGIGALQGSYPARVGRVKDEQEILLRQAAVWIENFAGPEKKFSVFYPGDLTSDPILRRLKFHLSPRMILLPVREFREVYDPVKFTRMEQGYTGPGEGVALVFDRRLQEDGMRGAGETVLLKSFPGIPLFIYGRRSENGQKKL